MKGWEAEGKSGLHFERGCLGRMGIEASLVCSLGINKTTEHCPASSHPGYLYSLAIPTLSSLTVFKVLLFPLTRKHTLMCGLFWNHLPLPAGSLTDPEGSDREECCYTYSRGPYFPVHQPLTFSGWFPRTQPSCQGSPLGSICRKPHPRIRRVHVEFNLKKAQFCICLS